MPTSLPKFLPEHPFKGALPFSETETNVFFGRDEVCESLFNLVTENRLTVLYGRPGNGRTSLLRAGLVPKLRREGFTPVFLRPGLALELNRDPDDVSYINCLSAFTAESVAGAFKDSDFRSPPLSQDNFPLLWRCLYALDQRSHREFHGVVIILDQFEDLLVSDRRSEVAAFLSETRNIVQNRPPEVVLRAAEKVLAKDAARNIANRDELIRLARGETSIAARFILSVREDFLAGIERLGKFFPGILKAAFRVRPFLVEEARAILAETLKHWNTIHPEKKFEITEGAANLALDYLSKTSDEYNFGFKENQDDNYIDPTQFQILFLGLYEDATRSSRTTISKDHIEKPGVLDEVFNRYYSRVLRRFSWLRIGPNERRWRASRSNWLIFNSPRLAVADLCEKGLVLPDNTMNTLAILSARSQFGPSESDIDELERARLVVRKSRSGGEFIELAQQALLPMLSRAIQRRHGRARNTALMLGLVAVILLWVTRPDVPLAKYAAWKGGSSAALRYLQYTDSHVDFSNRHFPETQRFQGLTFHGPKLSEAGLHSVRFYRVIGDRADFSGAHIPNGYFSEDDFEQARFDTAELKNAIFREVNLSKADFYRAILDNVSFLNSNLYNANFTNILTSEQPSRVLTLYGSNWWMSIGWPQDDLRMLADKFGTVSYKNSEVYRKGLKEKCDYVSSAIDPSQKALALNDLAWYLIVGGGDVAYVAEIIKLARGQLPNSKSGPALGDSLSPTLATQIDETEAELKMRKHEFAEARVLYESIARVVVRPDWEFRRKLATLLSSSEENDKKAQGVIKLTQKGYSPTYERVLFYLDEPSNIPNVTSHYAASCAGLDDKYGGGEPTRK